jgi:hypothetical protein
MRTGDKIEQTALSAVGVAHEGHDNWFHMREYPETAIQKVSHNEL